MSTPSDCVKKDIGKSKYSWFKKKCLSSKCAHSCLNFEVKWADFLK